MQGPLLVNNNGGRADSRISPSSPAATATCPHGVVVNPGLSRPSPSAFDLPSILSHFWSVPRVSAPPPPVDSFGWWPGKVGGDHRSFAQVVVSPSVAPSPSSGSSSTSMGEQGGRFTLNDGRRGGGGSGGRNSNAGRSDRGNRNLVWQCEEGGGGGSSTSGASSGRWDAAAAAAQGAGVNHGGGSLRGTQQPLPQPGRWEAGAATAQTSGKDKAVAQGSGSSRSAQQNPLQPDSSCLNCGSKVHFTARCPTIRCERCGKLGHINQICQAKLPWECTASMCGFQSPGQGFFYFPDSSSNRHVKDRASSLVITVLEGNPASRDIEKEFTVYMGSSWRCTARPINSTQFIMRFPNNTEVNRALFWGKSYQMKTFDVVLNLSPWSAAIGASGMLNKAWVRVRNIPPEKRCDDHAAYAGSLVGVTLEVDQATLHKPEYCRILLGCRDINSLP
ncbi:hypothetical protein ACQ4PT_045255 [Festuca glaucescens]